MVQSIIGKATKYYDYLGNERYGHIVAVEPYPYDPELAWIYIEDNELDLNIHSLLDSEIKQLSAAKSDNAIYYAELRLSNEVLLDE